MCCQYILCGYIPLQQYRACGGMSSEWTYRCHYITKPIYDPAIQDTYLVSCTFYACWRSLYSPCICKLDAGSEVYTSNSASSDGNGAHLHNSPTHLCAAQAQGAGLERLHQPHRPIRRFATPVSDEESVQQRENAIPKSTVNDTKFCVCVGGVAQASPREWHRVQSPRFVI